MGLMDKAKEAVSGNKGSSGDDSGKSQANKFANDQVKTQTSNATDAAGLGDKHDKKISSGINDQVDNQFKK